MAMQADTFNDKNNEARWLQGILGNDEAALKQLYQSEFFKTKFFVIKNKGTAEQAKDIYQEAFIAVWRNVQLGSFIPQSETALAGYLYQVAKNKWIDYLRSAYYNETIREGDVEANYELVEEMPADQSEYINQIKKGLQQLGENCKEVLGRFYYKNETMKAIATAMNWTEATARNNKYRCLEKLRELVKK